MVAPQHKAWRGGNLEQFMFGISVIESHSYIKVRKLCVAGDINARRWLWGGLEGGGGDP